MKTLQDYGIKELKDGLTLERIEKDFNWILKADINDAIIGISEDNQILFYDGTWEGDLWDGVVWHGGNFETGTWHDELWKCNL